ncbi:MAG: primosomal protein N' [Actinomyces urogenitalis]|uniref:primosomal protein N' n=1 Tax=Actinomyces urogenitalis TaxID=103621 RepID=UPI002A805809|nr:primosomal protein N' [Actinomyces urogenitalis]MDY3679063.1 primosomal protein N' [Actinomyces urogenitalis]
MSQSGHQDALLVVPAPAERTVRVPGVVDPVARVILDSPLPHLDRPFDYLVPPELDVAAAVGTRVTVTFGGQEIHGWLWERGSTTTHTGRLTALRRVVSDLPVVPPSTRRLVEAVAERTAGTRADVLRLAVPARHARTERAERDREVSVPALPTPAADGETGWAAYDGGPQFLQALAQAAAPRAVWTALPGRTGVVEDWQVLLARAVSATLSAGRGALVLTATTAGAQSLAARLAACLEAEQGQAEPVVVLSAEHGPARRYKAFLAALLGHARVIVGTRAAAFAPVHNLGLAVIWDDGDDRLDEPRSPYVHARTVLALRSGLEKAGLLIAGYSRSIEAHSYVAQGWAEQITAPRELIRHVIPRVQVPGAPELEAEGASGYARIPSLAHRALREALHSGPVLVQVPRGGYAPVVACASCRTPAHCATCAGPVMMSRSGEVSCRWCGRQMASWSCSACGHTRLRMVAVGSARTADELGRAFPMVPVVVSGAREDHGVIQTVDARPRLVVATPGAEPVAEGGYQAVLLLDGATLSARPDLGASSEALRRWSGAVVLARPQARVILLGGPAEQVAQALVRWDHAGFARRELTERTELGLPPALRCARLDGPPKAVESVLEEARSRGWDVLGPVDVRTLRRPSAAGPAAQGAAASVQSRALIRVPLSQGRELATMLRLELRERSVHREEAVRVELDPTVLW